MKKKSSDKIWSKKDKGVKVSPPVPNRVNILIFWIQIILFQQKKLSLIRIHNHVTIQWIVKCELRLIFFSFSFYLSSLIFSYLQWYSNWRFSNNCYDLQLFTVAEIMCCVKVCQKIKSSIELTTHCDLYTSVPTYLIKITKKEGLVQGALLA